MLIQKIKHYTKLSFFCSLLGLLFSCKEDNYGYKTDSYTIWMDYMGPYYKSRRWHGWDVKIISNCNDFIVINYNYEHAPNDTLWVFDKDSIQGEIHHTNLSPDTEIHVRAKREGHLHYSDFRIKGNFTENRYIRQIDSTKTYYGVFYMEWGTMYSCN
ncbi:MAG: hypothetical protein MJ197_09235 [Bacteroidales bacterium]|nr:hypothetical protein [Bacteroidales bacterium]